MNFVTDRVDDRPAGHVFHDAHEEGVTGSQVDGAGVTRTDPGDQPNGTDPALPRRYFDGAASVAFGPHRSSELHVRACNASRRGLP